MLTQVKLLRVLEEKVIERVGDNQPIHINVRIVSATNKDLKKLVEQGLFREDLFYRINVIPIHVPPLRERVEDIPILAEAFFRRIRLKTDKKINSISNAAMQVLMAHSWPGNVRELENLLHRAVALSEENELQIEPSARQALTREAVGMSNGAAPPDDDQITIQSDLQSHLDSAEREILIQALRETGFNRTAAAARLGLSLRQMRYRIARLHIDTPHTGEAPDGVV